MERPTTIPAFRQIGKGFCGSVWAIDADGPACAMKREDGGPERFVSKDSHNHVLIEQSFAAVRAPPHSLLDRLNLPAHRELISGSDSAWWTERSHRFPFGYEACNTLITERILPLPKKVREKIIDTFCIESSKAAVKASRKDEDCLIRPYLGRRKERFSSPSPFFTLRNKPLCIQQLESLNLPVEEYARAMAETLAVMYWHSHLDANDIEFVLAPPRHDEKTKFDSNFLGPHRIWVLDFDCVKAMTMDEEGIEQAARAWWRNDPWFPRPEMENKADQRLWEVFKDRFLEAISLLIPEDDERLPVLFVERLEEMGRERREEITRLNKEK